MNFARVAIENSRITIIGIFLLVAMGITTFLNYPSAEDPSIAIRTASIDASFPGMSATRIEELIAIPIENAMREIAEIDEIRSTSKSGAVKVVVDIDFNNALNYTCSSEVEKCPGSFHFGCKGGDLQDLFTTTQDPGNGNGSQGVSIFGGLMLISVLFNFFA